jgi:hypothetical protein
MNEELLEHQEEEEKSPLDGFKNTFKNFEWGISLSVGGYLFLIFLGVTYNFFYFMIFRINIFLFSEINDFLMAPLANPLVIVLGLLSVGLLFGLMYLGFLWKKKHPKSYKIFFRIMTMGRKADKKNMDKMAKMNKSPVFISFGVLMYLFVAAQYYAIYRSTKTSHDKNLYHYKLSIDKDLVKNLDSLVYVGDNSAHYFLFDTIKREATVIPKEQVKFVRIIKNPRGRFL